MSECLFAIFDQEFVQVVVCAAKGQALDGRREDDFVDIGAEFNLASQQGA